MLAEAKYHSHQHWNGKTYQIRSRWSDGSGFAMPKTYFEVWDQEGKGPIIFDSKPGASGSQPQWFRSVGAANKKAHELIAEGRLV